MSEHQKYPFDCIRTPSYSRSLNEERRSLKMRKDPIKEIEIFLSDFVGILEIVVAESGRK